MVPNKIVQAFFKNVSQTSKLYIATVPSMIPLTVNKKLSNASLLILDSSGKIEVLAARQLRGVVMLR